MKMKKRIIAAITLASLSLAFAVHAQENIGTGQSPLTISNVRNWTANQNVVPVCWETQGFDREKAIAKAAVLGSWEFFANVRFTGWAACPTGGIGGSATQEHV